MELHIYTGQIGKYKGPDAFDVTVKSGDRTFAPTWDMVHDSKAGRLSWEDYSERYRELMLNSYRRDQKAWHDILEKGTITLLCYCRTGENCHRYLLADFLCKLGQKTGVWVINEGERPVSLKKEAANIGDKDQHLQESLFY